MLNNLGLRRTIRGKRNRGGRTDGIVESGLVVEYKFDEGSGTTVTDHASGYNMTFGAGAAAPAWDSYGLDFDGTADYVTAAVPDSVFIGAGGFTAIIVANHDTYAINAYFMGKGTAATAQPIDWRTSGFVHPIQMYLIRGNTAPKTHTRPNLEIGDWKMFGLVAPQNIEEVPTQYINTSNYYCVKAAETATGPATGTNTDLRVGFNTSRKLDGHAAYALIYNRQLTQAEMQQNYNALRTILSARSITLPAIGTALVFHGDSLTIGKGISDFGEDYPSQLIASIGAGYDKWNLGLVGSPLDSFGAGLLSDGPLSVDTIITDARSKHICIFWGGGNDIDDGKSAAATYAQLQTYVAARLAAGFDDVIILTALDRFQYSADQRIQYAAYNTLIKDGAATGGYTVADVDGDARLQDFTDTTYFNADQVHLIAAGYAVVAGIVQTAIEAVLAA